MHIRSLMLLCSLISVCIGVAAQNLNLRIQGSNTIGAQLMPELVRAWLSSQGYASIRLERDGETSRLHGQGPDGHKILVEIQALGSSTAFTGLRDAQADLGIRTKEIGQLAPFGLMTSLDNEHVIALDGIAVIVHPTNPLERLDKRQIRDIFAGNIRDWKQVGGESGAIRLYARDDQSGTFDVFRALVLDKATQLAPSANRYADNLALSAAVTADRGASALSDCPMCCGRRPLRLPMLRPRRSLPAAFR